MRYFKLHEKFNFNLLEDMLKLITDETYRILLKVVIYGSGLSY